MADYFIPYQVDKTIVNNWLITVRKKFLPNGFIIK